MQYAIICLGHFFKFRSCRTMGRAKHNRQVSSQATSQQVKLTADLLSDNVPTSFSNMEWCFQENKDYASMQRKQLQKRHWKKRDGEPESSKSESRSEEEEGERYRDTTMSQEEPQERNKIRGFAIQIKNNDPIIFDDDSVSTLTHWDRSKSPRKESGDLSDMLGPFQHGSRNWIYSEAVEETKSVDKGNDLSYEDPTTPSADQNVEIKTSNTIPNRQRKINRAKQRMQGKKKENPSLLSVESASTRSARSSKSESIAKKMAIFEKTSDEKINFTNKKPTEEKKIMYIRSQISLKKKRFQSSRSITSEASVDQKICRSNGTQSEIPSPKPSPKVPESTGAASERSSLRTCLKNGASDKSTRSISSCLKNGNGDRSIRSASSCMKSVTFLDEDTELGSDREQIDTDFGCDSSLTTSAEYKKSLRYKKYRVSKGEKKLQRRYIRMESGYGSRSGIASSQRNYCDFSILMCAFDLFGKNKTYNLAPSEDEDDEEEKAEETKEDSLKQEIQAIPFQLQQ